MTKEQLSAVESALQEFFSNLEVAGDMDVSSPQENTVSVVLTIENPGMLIGENGQTILEIQHLLRRIVQKRLAVQEPLRVLLDVNNYRKSKEEYLKKMASDMADEVLLFKKPKELSPMSAFERRIVHEEISKRPGLVSESAGEGAERRIVIRIAD